VRDLIFFTFFAAGIIAATAFLQTDSAGWKGLVGAIVLLALGLTNVLFLQVGPSENPANSPQLGITASLVMGALLVAVGSITSLILRSRLSAGRIAMLALIGSWILLQILILAI
jgi:hypothetical protein